MCMICTDLALGKLKAKEADRNLEETLKPTDEHYWEVAFNVEEQREKERKELREKKSKIKVDFTGKTKPPGRY